MRVVIDTNILVSAAIADRNPEAVILFVGVNSEFEWVVSAEILSEYKLEGARGIEVACLIRRQ